MTPAPPLDCAACGRRIGKTAGHLALDCDAATPRVVCMRCAWDRHLHARFYPDCTDRDHRFVIDHGRTSLATRAGAAALLGLWPERTVREETPR